MEVSLPRDLERMVREKVASGKYLTHSEVIVEALYLLQDRDDFRAMKREKLRKEIQVGIDQARQGRTKRLDVEQMKRRVKAALVKRKKRHSGC
jgi:antitoxin ParD1/3/4